MVVVDGIVVVGSGSTSSVVGVPTVEVLLVALVVVVAGRWW